MCVKNGSPRDVYSRWFTCGLVKGPQAPHSAFFFFHSHGCLSVLRYDNCEGISQDCPRFLGPERRIHIMRFVDESGRLATIGVSHFADFRKFLRSEAGDIACLSLEY